MSTTKIPSKCPICGKVQCTEECPLFFDPATFAVRKEKTNA